MEYVLEAKLFTTVWRKVWPQNDIARLLTKLWWEHPEKSEPACWFAPNRESGVIPLLSSRWQDLGCHWINGYKSPPPPSLPLTTGWVASFWTISTMVALIRFNCYNWPNGQIDLRRVCRLRTLINLASQPSQTKKRELVIAPNQAAKMIVLCIAEVSLGHSTHVFLGLFLWFIVNSSPVDGSYKDIAFVLKGTRRYNGNNLKKGIVGILIINITGNTPPFNEVKSCSLYCLLNRKEQPVKSQYWMTHTRQMTNRRHSFLFFLLTDMRRVSIHCHSLDSQPIVRFPKCNNWIWLGTDHEECFFIPSHYYLYSLSFHVGDGAFRELKRISAKHLQGLRFWGCCRCISMLEWHGKHFQIKSSDYLNLQRRQRGKKAWK